MKRLFAAIKIFPDPEYLKKYQELRSILHHEQIKWVEEKNIHVTLHFFGETEERRMFVINSVIGNLAEKTEPFTLRLSGLGLFGSSYSPRVIWTGIESGCDIAAIMKELKTMLSNNGFDTDRQNIVPHLTLGRIKMIRDRRFFQQTIDSFNDIVSIPVTIKEIVLLSSKLQSMGPVYAVEKSFLLQKPLMTVAGSGA